MDQLARLCHRCGYRPTAPEESCCPTDGMRLVAVTEHERSPRDPFLGCVLGGKYPILGILGAGGMGNVYLSHHPSLGTDLAIKVIRPEVLLRDSKAGARFRREARAMARLSTHPGVATLFDFGSESDQTLFMVMERVVGENLHQAFRRGGLSARELLDVVLSVLDVLCVAHARGVLHRDLKPGNIVLLSDRDRYGRQLRVKVLDFGLAKLQHSDPSLGAISLQGITQGTPTYMAPEQFRGEPVDHRADLYALATILYEGLAGRPPFMLLHPEEPSDVLQLGQMKAYQAPEPLPALPHLPPALARLILQGMARRPEDRFVSAEQMAAALEEIDLGEAGASPLPPSIAAVGGELAEPESLDENDLEQVLDELAEEISLASGDLLAIDAQDPEERAVRGAGRSARPRGRVLHPTPRPGPMGWLRSLDPDDAAWTAPPPVLEDSPGDETSGGETAQTDQTTQDDGTPEQAEAVAEVHGPGWQRLVATLFPGSAGGEPPEAGRPRRSRGSWGPLLLTALGALLLWTWKDPGAGPAGGGNWPGEPTSPISASVVPAAGLPGGASVGASPVGRSAAAAVESARGAATHAGHHAPPAPDAGAAGAKNGPVGELEHKGEEPVCREPGSTGPERLTGSVQPPATSVAAGVVGKSADCSPSAAAPGSTGAGSPSFCRSPADPPSAPVP